MGTQEESAPEVESIEVKRGELVQLSTNIYRNN